MERRIVSKRFVTWSEAREIMLERIQDEESGVRPEQERTWEYLKEFGVHDPQASREAVERIMELGVKEEVAVNIVSFCPRQPGEVRLILDMDKENRYSEEVVSKIMEIVEECRGKSSREEGEA
ncbi:MAG: hypothetical protein GSR78_05610 [Desulfurococcales archaeon]|nr:hypothetical protein [Desulfurococcales archaeon]